MLWVFQFVSSVEIAHFALFVLWLLELRSPTMPMCLLINGDI
jgi:hypothetical protein